ncbi:MAG TPA: Asp-tRNA(Asn)/Glu-tRNA(Gln) amidotransferase subunit GatA [Candidatus Aquicultor sp.]|jgi:aspartyl-tRNA(Asn)/glutamyl-tRNA(Gln) amidotransferase subunit A
MELYQMTIHELHKKLKNKEISSKELTESVFSRIDAVEDDVKSYLTVTKDVALEQAAAVDAKIAAGVAIGPLAGIPTAIKDVMCTKGIRTTCGSKILENFVPVYTSTAVQNLLNEGIVMTGKTNMDEFAMGSSTENSGYFPTRNPWDIERVPGGSSGGSAAVVAADEAIFSLGSDTGGSIRQPAALCGIVGMKPTYGLVSRFGLVAFASSLDQIGPFTKDVTDCAIVLNHLVGHDANDSTSVPIDKPDYTKALVNDLKGMRVGVPKELMAEGIDPEVRKVVEDALKLFEENGATVAETSLPNLEHGLSAYYIIAPAEASSNLARFDGVRYGYRASDSEDLMDMYMRTRAEGFGDEVKRRIMLGTYALSAGYYEAYYGQAQKVRTLITRDFNNAFEDFDVLVSPTSPTTAFKLGEKTADPLQMYLSDICTIPVNLAGLPGISVPCGTVDGLPVGLHIMGKMLGEEMLLRAAYSFEQQFGWNEKPKL